MGSGKATGIARNGDFGARFVAILVYRFGESLQGVVGHQRGGTQVAKPRDNRQKDLLRPALEEVIDLVHPLVRLAREIDWQFLDGRFSSVCTAGEGRPPLPTRLVAGLFILKHTCTTCRTRCCARAGWRTRITNFSAAS
jgi:hypothetical protein